MHSSSADIQIPINLSMKQRPLSKNFNHRGEGEHENTEDPVRQKNERFQPFRNVMANSNSPSSHFNQDLTEDIKSEPSAHNSKDLADIQSVLNMTASSSNSNLRRNFEESVNTTSSQYSYDRDEEEAQDAFTSEFRKMKLHGAFPCKLCPAVYPSLRALKGHNRVHLSEAGPAGPFRCNVCPYSICDKPALNRHMRTHNGVRPYVCAVCNSAFTSKQNCENHLRNRHAKTTREDVNRSIKYHPSEDSSCEDTTKKLHMFAAELEENRGEEKVEFSVPLISLPKPELNASGETHKHNMIPTETDPKLEIPTLDTQHQQLVLGQQQLLSDSNQLMQQLYRNLLFPQFPPLMPNTLVLAPLNPRNFSTKPQLSPLMAEKSSSAALATMSSPKNLLSPNPNHLAMPTHVMPPTVSAHSPNLPPIMLSNGVFIPKQNQRFRTEQPFACKHCSVRFTLHASMERHLKKQHPQLYAQRRKQHIMRVSGASSAANINSISHFQSVAQSHNGSAAPSKTDLLQQAGSNSVANSNWQQPPLNLNGQNPFFTFNPSHAHYLNQNSTPNTSMEDEPKLIIDDDEEEEKDEPKLIVDEDDNEEDEEPKLIIDEDYEEEEDETKLIIDEDDEEEDEEPKLIIDEDDEEEDDPKLIIDEDDEEEDEEIPDDHEENYENYLILNESEYKGEPRQLPTTVEELKLKKDKPQESARKVAESILAQAIKPQQSISSFAKTLDPSIATSNNNAMKSMIAQAPAGGKFLKQVASSSFKDESQDLVSVSELVDNATNNSVSFTRYFRQWDVANHMEPKDEDGLVASSASESNNSGAEDTVSTEKPKKESAYSLAPNRVHCPYCHRMFPWSSSLRRHILTHTGQMPFKCSHCPLLFTTKSNCDRHILRKHGDVESAC